MSVAKEIHFSTLKSEVSDRRETAKAEAIKYYPVVKSRGVEVAGLIDGNKVTDGTPLNAFTKKELASTIDAGSLVSLK